MLCLLAFAGTAFCLSFSAVYYKRLLSKLHTNQFVINRLLGEARVAGCKCCLYTQLRGDFKTQPAVPSGSGRLPLYRTIATTWNRTEPPIRLGLMPSLNSYYIRHVPGTITGVAAVAIVMLAVVISHCVDIVPSRRLMEEEFCCLQALTSI